MTNTSYAAEGHGSLLVLALLALIVGAAAGLVGAIFRLTLQQADRLRDALIGWAQGEKLAGFLIVVVTCAAAVLIAAWLVRRFSSRIGKRHPPCRGRAERRNPASAVSPHLGEILRRCPRNRLRAGTRSRGPERADGG